MSAQPAVAISGPPAEAELVERARRGDSAAIEVLVRRHNRALFRTARAILRDDAEAEDVVQETYLKAFRALATFRGESSFSTWLTRIAANQALMRLRSASRADKVIPIDHHHGASLMEAVEDEGAGPESAAMSAEMRRLLERRIDELPDLYRAVFVMRAVEEMSVEETGAALGLPEATVRTRFFRARALLRGALEHEIDFAMKDAFAFDGERCDRIVRGVLAGLAVAG
jgi:RNA polymerase sigma-70 factor (ECF subfamily)